MITALDDACHQSSDPPDAPRIVVAEHVRGRVGRPRLNIDPAFLSEALKLRGPTGIAPVLNCSARTVRRRAVEMGIASPAPSVYQQTVDVDSGAVAREYIPRLPAAPTMTAAELDSRVLEALTIFPGFGRRMLAGHFEAHGLNVPRADLRASYIRVHGSPALFGDRHIHRRAYKVAGSNSLWHHDGQHGEYILHHSKLTSVHSPSCRFNPLQNSDSLFYRWQGPIRHRHTCWQQQPRINSPRLV